MKYDVLQFIDSDILREMLHGKELAPAVECILIAQSRKQPLTKKLEALTERAETYTDAEFRTGVYNLRDCENFADALRKYIAVMQQALQEKDAVSEDYIYQAYTDLDLSNAVFTSFAAASNYLRREIIDGMIEDECYEIIRRKINDSAANPVVYLLNGDCEILSVRLRYSEDLYIEEAFCELPDKYNIGDIIQYQDDYFVIASVIHADNHTRWLTNADYGDMSLYCFRYYPDKLHSCGGSFGHYHVPILQTEMAKPEDLPENMKPLTALSLMLKGEMKITDFLESYSNGALEELMYYYGKKTT